MPTPEHERLLAHWSGGEDAALFTLDEERVGILTVDFITPVVDDPYQWGRIAAANSLSDVFAMGGRPLCALNLVCFPLNCQPLSVLKAVMEGGAQAVRESGAFLAGGHSIEDKEPKYGLCVYGEGSQNSLWRTTGGKAGDVVVLTKKIGTGPVATALKADMVSQSALQDATESMALLNTLPRFMSPSLHQSITSCTDITGFGLAGHLLDMASDQKIDIHIDWSHVPLIEGAKEYAEMGLLPVGAFRNKERYLHLVHGQERENDFLYDPQTSGGLAFTLPEEQVQELVDLAHQHQVPVAIIGHVEPGTGKLHVHP